MKMSKHMWRVLRKLRRRGPGTANGLKCKVVTLMALERRGLIRVETSFQAIISPRKAMAWLTPDGAKFGR